MSVISPQITPAEFDAVNRAQHAYLDPLLRSLITGREKSAIDFGCGPGRITPLLAGLLDPTATVVGFDPCGEFIAMAPRGNGIVFMCAEPLSFIRERVAAGVRSDIVFCWLVLGGIEDDGIAALAGGIASLVAPGGLLIFADHVAETQPEGKWWRFRPEAFYRDLFAAPGVPIEPLGQCAQLENEVAIFAGRRS